MNFRLLSYALLASVSFGCATVFTGTHDPVRIGTDMRNASIYIDEKLIGSAPAIIVVERKGFSAADLKAEIRSTDDHCEFRIRRETNPYAYLNGADPVGWWIDYATGALWRFRPDRYYVTREAATGACATQ